MKSPSTLFQFTDSVLPIGSYAHSFGLEGLCEGGWIGSGEELAEFLEQSVLQSLLRVDLPVARMVACGDLGEEKLFELDELAWALRPSGGQRQASGMLGRQLEKLYARLTGSSLIAWPRAQANIVFARIAKQEGWEELDWMLSFIYQTYSMLTQAGVKLLRLGPSEAQEILYRGMQNAEKRLLVFKDWSIENVGFSVPSWDIASSQHESTERRLFIT